MASVRYTVEEIPESVHEGKPASTINVVLKQGYKNPRHLERLNMENYDYNRRDLFSAYINEEHPDETLRGNTVFLKRFCLNSLVPNSMSGRLSDRAGS